MNTMTKLVTMLFACMATTSIAAADTSLIQSDLDKVDPVPYNVPAQSQQGQRLPQATCAWLAGMRIDALQTDMRSSLYILQGGRYYSYIPGNSTSVAETARLMEDLSYRGIKPRLCVSGTTIVQFFWFR